MALVGWLGEIRGYGSEIRGEISQHLAAHMHTRPSWETEPQIQAWTTWKRHQRCCQREESLPLSLQFSVFPSRPLNLPCICALSSSFILSSSPRLPSISFSRSSLRRFSRMHVCVREKSARPICVCLSDVPCVRSLVFPLPDKMSSKRQMQGGRRDAWMGGLGRKKICYMVNRLFKGSTSWGHSFILSQANRQTHTHTHTLIGLLWVRGHSIYTALGGIKTVPQPGGKVQGRLRQACDKKKGWILMANNLLWW